MKTGKVVAIIPARLGSQRVKVKSLRLLNGKPLIEYIIDSLKDTKNFKDILINSDSEYFAEIAKQKGIGFYKRRPDLATSQSLIDDYLYDFMVNYPCDYLAVVNPTSPFITSEELDEAWTLFAEHDYDTLLSCEKIQTHCFYKGEPINFSTASKHPRSQDLEPIRALNFAITIFSVDKYRKQYEAHACGVYTGKLGFYDTEGNANIDIDYEEDFVFAEFVSRFMASGISLTPQYSDIIKPLIDADVRTEN